MKTPFLKIDNDNYEEEVNEDSVFGKYYVKICETMKKHNVPKDRIPSFPHFISKAFSYLDEKRMENWILKYIENEKADILEIENDGF